MILLICNPSSFFYKGEDKEHTECQFRIHKDKKTGLIRLESVKMPGVFLGIGETGRVKHAVDAGDKISGLNIEIISCELFTNCIPRSLFATARSLVILVTAQSLGLFKSKYLKYAGCPRKDVKRYSCLTTR